MQARALVTLLPMHADLQPHDAHSFMHAVQADPCNAVATGLKVNSKTRKGTNALHFAAKKGVRSAAQSSNACIW